MEPAVGTVLVEGKGYVRIAKARAYEALGHKVHWGTKLEPAENIEPLQFKDD